MPDIDPYFPNGEPNSPDVLPQSLELPVELKEELLRLPQTEEIWYIERFSFGVVSKEVGPLEFYLVARGDSEIRSVITISPLEPQASILNALYDTMKAPSNTHPQRPKRILVSQEKHGKFINHLFQDSLNIEAGQADNMKPVHEARGRLSIKERP